MFTITSKQDLISHVLNICALDSETKAKMFATCQILVDRMPERIKALIKAKGGHTRY